ncbi:hypothetical protein [Pseudoalteromonas denitrificans]|jgi:hypothetical protein|uniref:Uncharacterized protein n=1 Tax=Pseudoalteromonas denitrificans DSM 6059 TaxID=1123010 RepID=A0A1I1GSV3_9GAMM|nr:hypothetical protein [Pseudoalteromonas denitrificans]SFC14581.1 hypothetical protein SAMN02745724_01017 [Pseudoalteromonas denitrificans DSM 6059]
MDNLLPFLPRVAHIEPLNKQLIIVAGIKEAKIKALNKEARKSGEYEAKNNKNTGKSEAEEQKEEHNHLDTWA